MTAELICVGTELLLGNITDVNGPYLARKCAQLGLSVYYQNIVGDNEKRIKECFENALKRSDVVILCGGMGSAKDDLTKKTVIGIMGGEFCDALVLENENGTASGMILEEGEKTVVLLPGAPQEMEPMFEKKVYPYLREKQPEVICSETLKICKMTESQVEEKIADLIEKQENPTIAVYPKPGEVHVRITAKAEDEKTAKKLMKPIVREVKVRFGAGIYATDEFKTLEEAVVELLTNQDVTLTTVESCTGGALSARIVSVPGASEVLKQGFVTYSNKAKRHLTMVKKSTLKEYGAVSEKCAKEMAKGGIVVTGADAAVSVTGIAGPDGGTEETPVGTVFIGCYFKGKTVVEEYHFSGDRSSVREQAVVSALVLLRECILENFNPKD